MRLKSFALASLCLLAFACKKESGEKKSPTTAPTVSDGNQTGTPGSMLPGANPGSVSDIPQSCRTAVDCMQNLPDPGKALGFSGEHKSSLARWSASKPVHRARDMFMLEGQDTTLIAKFAYAIGLDKDVKDEQVDIYMSLGCQNGWKNIGSLRTSKEPSGEKKIVDSVEDTGGYIMASLSSLGVKDLAVGRHRFVFFLRANNQYTESYVEVLPKKNAIVLTDIDGTLTAFEEAAAIEVFDKHPDGHEGAADMMKSFYHRGYSIFYLTARPAFLMERTRKWLNKFGFPPGIIHTTSLVQGAVGEAAAKYKVTELELLKKNTGVTPTYAFGNKPSDVKAFADGGIPKENSWFYKIAGDTTGAQAHDDYRKLIPTAQTAPSFCP